MAASQGLGSRKKTDRKGVGAKKANIRWEKPVLEDVSGKVMAQPYIRFT